MRLHRKRVGINTRQTGEANPQLDLDPEPSWGRSDTDAYFHFRIGRKRNALTRRNKAQHPQKGRRVRRRKELFRRRSASPYQVGQNVASVFRLPYAPKDIFSISSDYTFLHTRAGALDLVLDYRYQDRQFETAPTGPAVPNAARYYSVGPYGVLDARLTWNINLASSKSARISLWGHNITNRRYPADVIGQGPAVPLPGQVPGTTVGPGYTYQSIAWAPRPIYGVDFAYGF